MPDADDFDVEYFRILLKGNRPEEKSAPPAEPALPAARKKKRPTPKPAASKDKSAPAAVLKKGKKGGASR